MKEEVKNIEYVVITPTTLKVLVQYLPHGKNVGIISIEYPQLLELQNYKDEDDYDEDEQLYSAVMKKSMMDKYGKIEIPIVLHGSYLSINVPHFQNTIVNNIFASKVTAKLHETVGKAWIVLSPSLISTNETINKLNIESDTKMPAIYEAIPNLQPPHFITGIGASFNSQISLLHNSKLMSLVLRAEGQSGFEKVDSDSLVDTCFVLGELLVNPKDRDHYLKQVSFEVRKINGSANSGMYI